MFFVICFKVNLLTLVPTAPFSNSPGTKLECGSSKKIIHILKNLWNIFSLDPSIIGNRPMLSKIVGGFKTLYLLIIIKCKNRNLKKQMPMLCRLSSCIQWLIFELRSFMLGNRLSLSKSFLKHSFKLEFHETGLRLNNTNPCENSQFEPRYS